MSLRIGMKVETCCGGDISVVERGDGWSKGRWFDDNMSKKIENKCNTLFWYWYEPLLDGDVLKDCFIRLFNFFS